MRKIFISLVVLVALISMGAIALVSAQDDAQAGNAPERDSVAVTIYNQGTALVQDVRTFNFNVGENLINFTDVAALMDPTSVSFNSITDPAGTRVLEQNYVYDLVDSSALLARYVDEVIQVTTDDGAVFTGELLSGRGGDIILRDNNGAVQVIGLGSVRDLQFPELPSGLITRPTLRWLLNSINGGEQQVELTYLTGGINWSADYNILLATNNESFDINGWVTLNNTSGTAYENAQVKLVAGDVNRLPETRAVAESGFYYDDAIAFDMAFAAPAVEQREFFEYQLYEIARNVTVGNNETKQVEFVTGADVEANAFFVYDGSPEFFGYFDFITDPGYGFTGVTDVQSYLEFSTSEESGLGADLPAGRIRVYQEDVDGAALLIGENQIDHTPEGEEVEIFLGNAFDLVGERFQMDFNPISRDVVEETYEIRLRNRKDAEAVEIRVPERFTRGQNWEIVNSSLEFTQTDAFSIEFRAQVPAGEEVVITYTVRYTRP